MRAVEGADLPLVEQLLRVHGAAIANHRRQLRIRLSFALFCDKIWDCEERPWPDNDPHQPFSPLRLVVFRISDCCLTPAQSASFRAIAMLLVSHNADACAGGLLFRSVWGVLSAAAQGQTSSSTQQLLAS
jgi:hypothetical protein